MKNNRGLIILAVSVILLSQALIRADTVRTVDMVGLVGAGIFVGVGIMLTIKQFWQKNG